MFALLMASALATALPPAGEWRLEGQQTKVKLLSWGMFCGKEPKDGRGIPGAKYTLTHSGTDFLFAGAGKKYGTAGCNTDPSSFHVRLADRTDKGVRVECEAPPVAGTPQVTLHTWEVTEGAVRYVSKGERRKTENMEDCRYAYETEMKWVLSTQSGPCASPGPAASLVLDPATLDAKPGQRVCFKIAAMDAQQCAVSAGTPAFSVEPAGAAELDANGCLWAPREVKEAHVIAVTAQAGGAKGGAVIRVAPEGGAPVTETIEQTAARAGNETVKKLISQVKAGEFVVKAPQEEDEPAAAAPPPPVMETAAGTPVWLFAAGGGGVLMVLAGLAFVLMRKKPAAPPVAPLVASTPPPPGKGWRCPKCKFEYAAPGLCVHDGAELVSIEVQVRATMFIPQVGGMICPTCGQKYPSRAKFCGNDRTPLVPDIPHA